MLDVAANYPNKAQPKMCPLCKDSSSQDSQKYIEKCPKLDENEVMDNTNPNYNDLVGKDISEKIVNALSN